MSALGIRAKGALRDDYSPMQEHKKDAETSEDYTSNETDPNKRTIHLFVSAIKFENTWDKCHQTDSDKDQTGDEFIHSIVASTLTSFDIYFNMIYSISPIVNTVRFGWRRKRKAQAI
jgi:hypothetical protein